MPPSALSRFTLALFLAGATAASADVSGWVRLAGSGDPGIGIPGAWVHVQGDLGATGTFSAAPDGAFTLAGVPAGSIVVAASIPYLRSAPANYTIGGASCTDGDSDVDIRLELLPAADNPTYVPAGVDDCGGCHFERYSQWQTSNHAFTAQNEWVLDLLAGTGTPGGGAGYVFRNSHDPGETGFCATCHATMADIGDPNPQGIFLDEVTEPYGLQGVTCVTCHQMDSVDEGNINALHHRGKSTYRFPEPGQGVDTLQYVWGPMNDVTFDFMRASHSTLHTASRVCASCHQYHNPETDAPGQNTYGEWQGSPFAAPGPMFRTCQDCHMPTIAGLGQNCEFGGPERESAERHAHTWIGSTPETLSANLDLLTTAEFTPEHTVRVAAAVDNFGAGHSFPTGISIRNAILLIQTTLNGEPLTQVAGPTVPFWGSDEVPGDQPGDLAGQPGKGFAKVLEGRINGEGPVVRPVLFIDAEGVHSDTLIPSGAIDTSEFEFALPDGFSGQGEVQVTATLLYRRGWRALAVTKGWTVDAHGGPIEIEVARDELVLAVEGLTVLEIPALERRGLVLFALLLAASFVLLRRRRAARR